MQKKLNLRFLPLSPFFKQEAVFRKADTNHDGQLDENEFITYNKDLTKHLNDADFEQEMSRWLAVSRIEPQLAVKYSVESCLSLVC